VTFIWHLRLQKPENKILKICLRLKTVITSPASNYTFNKNLIEDTGAVLGQGEPTGEKGQQLP